MGVGSSVETTCRRSISIPRFIFLTTRLVHLRKRTLTRVHTAFPVDSITYLLLDERFSCRKRKCSTRQQKRQTPSSAHRSIPAESFPPTERVDRRLRQCRC